jgi:hypothetical protein
VDNNDQQPTDSGEEQPILDDSRNPSSNMRSYALMTPEIKKAYMNFYKTPTTAAASSTCSRKNS